MICSIRNITIYNVTAHHKTGNVCQIFKIKLLVHSYRADYAGNYCWCINYYQIP